MPSPRLTILIVLAASLGASGAADACSVCLAGDPSFSAHGTQSQEAGSVAVYLEVRGYEKKSGRVRDATSAAPAAAPAEPASAASVRRMAHGGHEHWWEELEEGASGATTAASGEHDSREEHASRRVDLYVAWTPLDRVTVTLDVPWVANDITEIETDQNTHFELAGLGDVSLGVSGVVWRNRPALPSTWVELRGWVKAPSGRDEQRVDGVADSHIQAGTGSWDFGWGVAGVHRFDWGSLYASAFHRINTEGGYDYDYGDVALATVALEAPLGHVTGVRALDRVTPGFGLDFRFAARDHQHGRGVEDTGGAVLYATPSLRFALPAFGETQRAWLRTGVQVPLTDAWLFDRQEEGPVWSVGLGYAF